MPSISPDARKRLVTRLHTIAKEHRDHPDIAEMFLTLADNISAGRKPNSAAPRAPRQRKTAVKKIAKRKRTGKA